MSDLNKIVEQNEEENKSDTTSQTMNPHLFTASTSQLEDPWSEENLPGVLNLQDYFSQQYNTSTPKPRFNPLDDTSFISPSHQKELTLQEIQVDDVSQSRDTVKEKEGAEGSFYMIKGVNSLGWSEIIIKSCFSTPVKVYLSVSAYLLIPKAYLVLLNHFQTNGGLNQEIGYRLTQTIEYHINKDNHYAEYLSGCLGVVQFFQLSLEKLLFGLQASSISNYITLPLRLTRSILQLGPVNKYRDLNLSIASISGTIAALSTVGLIGLPSQFFQTLLFSQSFDLVTNWVYRRFLVYQFTNLTHFLYNYGSFIFSGICGYELLSTWICSPQFLLPSVRHCIQAVLRIDDTLIEFLRSVWTGRISYFRDQSFSALLGSYYNRLGLSYNFGDPVNGLIPCRAMHRGKSITCEQFAWRSFINRFMICLPIFLLNSFFPILISFPKSLFKFKKPRLEDNFTQFEHLTLLSNARLNYEPNIRMLSGHYGVYFDQTDDDESASGVDNRPLEEGANENDDEIQDQYPVSSYSNIKDHSIYKNLKLPYFLYIIAQAVKRSAIVALCISLFTYGLCFWRSRVGSLLQLHPNIRDGPFAPLVGYCFALFGWRAEVRSQRRDWGFYLFPHVLHSMRQKLNIRLSRNMELAIFVWSIATLNMGIRTRPKLIKNYPWVRLMKWWLK